MQTAVAIIVLMRFLEAKRKKKREGEEKERKNILQTLTNAIYFRRIYERKLKNSLCALSLSFVYLSTVVL